MKKVVILGSGQVGQALAKGFQLNKFDVTIASRDGKTIENWSGHTGTYQETVTSADLIVLAIKGTAAEEAVKGIASLIKRKIVIDVTNPIADSPPENGVIKYFTTLNESLMERLQKIAPESYFVKAFNSVGNAVFLNPDFGGEIPTMLICGDNEAAKKEVSEILDIFGWKAEDLGTSTSARAIEPLCMLWCIPGFLHNEWYHAFKLLKK